MLEILFEIIGGFISGSLAEYFDKHKTKPWHIFLISQFIFTISLIITALIVGSKLGWPLTLLSTVLLGSVMALVMVAVLKICWVLRKRKADRQAAQCRQP